jgi:hypothetical protein
MSTIHTASYAPQPLNYQVADPRLVAMTRLLRRGMVLLCIGNLVVTGTPVITEILGRIIALTTVGGPPIIYYTSPLRSVPAAVAVVLWGVSIALLRSNSRSASIVIRCGVAINVVVSLLSIVAYALAVGTASSSYWTYVTLQFVSIAGSIVIAIAVWVLASKRLLFADEL